MLPTDLDAVRGGGGGAVAGGGVFKEASPGAASLTKVTLGVLFGVVVDVAPAVVESCEGVEEEVMAR